MSGPATYGIFALYPRPIRLPQSHSLRNRLHKRRCSGRELGGERQLHRDDFADPFDPVNLKTQTPAHGEHGAIGSQELADLQRIEPLAPFGNCSGDDASRRIGIALEVLRQTGAAFPSMSRGPRGSERGA